MRRISESALKTLVNANLPKNLADLKFRYGKRKSFRGLAADHTVLISQQVVYRIVEELKQQIALPFKSKWFLKTAAALILTTTKTPTKLSFATNLLTFTPNYSREQFKGRTAQDEAAKGAVVAMFLHEVAHALIDGWDLSITGREEDAADQFSTLMLINGLPDSEEMALHSARSFESLAFLEKGLEKDYSDPHSAFLQHYLPRLRSSTRAVRISDQKRIATGGKGL